MQELIVIIHVLVAIGIVALVLMQHGKGADVGAAFGSGGANTMFGSAGTMPFLMKVTTALAAIFFATSLTLAYLAAHTTNQASLLDLPTSSTTPTVPKTQSVTVPTTKQNSKTTKSTNNKGTQ